MTIKDVAANCGVSVSTVSRVLNDKPDVSPEIRRKVIETMKRLHYVPSSSARDLVRTESDNIGVVVRGVGNPFFTSLIQSIEAAINRAGYSMVLQHLKTNADELEAAAEFISSRRLQGVILLGGRYDYTPEEIALLNVPFVFCTYSNNFGHLSPKSYSSVSIDDRATAYAATQLLLEQGHRRIGVLLDNKDDHSIGELRYMGYRQALEDAGLSVEESMVEEVAVYSLEAAYEGMKRLATRCPDMTAVFVIADSLAIAAIKALNDMKRPVPEDVSVIAIDGIDISAYTIPTLTTLVQPVRQMAEECVQLVVDNIEGKGCHRQVRLDTTLRVGASIRHRG